MMVALSHGLGRRNSRVVMGEPPADHNPFAVWGQMWLALRIVPPAVSSGRPFWHIDNGFYRPGRGSSEGYYRLTYRSLSPIMLADAPAARADALGVKMKAWRKDGDHIVIALPGVDFGTAMGMDMKPWIRGIKEEVRKFSTRPIRTRPKQSPQSLEYDLANAWALVTHSSNVAVDAVLAGIPVFVAATSPAAPVGNLDLANLDNPAQPDRKRWWDSLMCQQFTQQEMSRGVPTELMRAVARQTDGGL